LLVAGVEKTAGMVFKVVRGAETARELIQLLVEQVLLVKAMLEVVRFQLHTVVVQAEAVLMRLVVMVELLLVYQATAVMG
jgi:hypothetical protein